MGIIKFDYKGEPGRRAEAGSGGLSIYLQPVSPGKEREPNRLRTSAEHPWFVILRIYRPQPAVIEAKWECPGLTPLT